MAMPAAAPGPKYKAALSAAYAASLRVSEVVALNVSDIDSERLLLRIEQGRAARIALRCSPPGCWTCCATGIGERMRDLVQKWIAQWIGSGRAAAITASSSELERRMGGMGNGLVGLRAKGRRARVRRSPIRLVRSRPHASGAGGSFFRPPAPPAS